VLKSSLIGCLIPYLGHAGKLLRQFEHPEVDSYRFNLVRDNLFWSLQEIAMSLSG
jgi:hypothetical protein